MKQLVLNYNDQRWQPSAWYHNFSAAWKDDPDCWDYTEFLNSHNCAMSRECHGLEFNTEEDLTLFLLKYA